MFCRVFKIQLPLKIRRFKSKEEVSKIMQITTQKLSDRVTLFTVSNGWMSFSAMNYGCTVTNILVPDRNGNMTDVVLGFKGLKGYEEGRGSLGAIVGRFANRISNSSFTLDGKKYQLDKNDGENSLHGGFTRFEKQIWDAKIIQEKDQAGVVFSRLCTEEEQHYPGNLSVEVTYLLNGKNQLLWNYSATTDKATPVNLTNHSYFNLAGKGSILNHELILDYNKILEVSENLIPTGKILDAKGTAFDFSTAKKIGADINQISKKIGGYDHCFLTKAYETHKMEDVGTVSESSTGISMHIQTNQPGIQIYSGNWVQGISKNDVSYNYHDGICFETQAFPDAPNQPDFPSCILRPGEKYDARTILEFKNS